MARDCTRAETCGTTASSGTAGDVLDCSVAQAVVTASSMTAMVLRARAWSGFQWKLDTSDSFSWGDDERVGRTQLFTQLARRQATASRSGSRKCPKDTNIGVKDHPLRRRREWERQCQRDRLLRRNRECRPRRAAARVGDVDRQ